jgi:hypothetical protein
MMRTTAAALAVAAAGVLALPGCGGGGSTDEFCALNDRLDLADIDDLSELQSALDEAVEVAPDDIRDDVETVRDTLDEVAGRLEDQGVDSFSEATAEQREGLAELYTGDFQRATENIRRFSDANC